MAITEEKPWLQMGRNAHLHDLTAQKKSPGKPASALTFILPGMPHGKVVRSPFHAHARIVSIDTSAAESMEGVKAVITGADFPDLAANGAHPRN